MDVLLDHSNKNKFVFDVTDDPDTLELTDSEREIIIQRAIKKATKEKRVQLRYAQRNAEMDRVARKVAKKLDPFDYFRMIASQGEDKFEQFNFDKENKEVIEMLCMYFAQDPRFESRFPEYSLKKGLMMWGDVGCGKTSLMKFLRVNQVQSYRVIPCSDIALDFVRDGVDGLQKYCNYLVDCSSAARIEFLQPHCGICFDDLGTETISANYGNKVDVMGVILNSWYNKGRFNHIHVTTNLTADQMKESYGERIVSRMHEMFNIISFPEGAKDRR